jgi:CRP/FNR family transcriptional regulator
MITSEQIRKIDELFPVLAHMPEQERRQLFSAGQVVILPKDQMLMQQNQQCLFIPFVMSGILRIYKLSLNGREMTLYRTGPGETCLVSIACQLKGEDFPALAQVEEKVQLFMLPTGVYHAVLDHNVVWKDFLITSIYEHLTEVMQTLEAVAFDRMDYRLINWLLEKTNGKPGTIRYTHEAIAIELGTAREVISRLLGELKSKGALTLGREKIEIKNLSLLKQLLESG